MGEINSMVVLLVAAVVLGGLLARHVACHAAWRRTADKLGLTFHENSFWGDWEIFGEVRGCRVRLNTVKPTTGRRQRSTRLAVSGQRKISTQLELGPETLLSRASRMLGSGDLVLGDPEFDVRVRVRGRPEIALGVLDARTRTTLKRFVTTWRGEVLGGEVGCDTPHVVRKARQIEGQILDAVRVAESVQVPQAGYLEAIQHSLERDHVPAVRLQCLEILVQHGAERAARARQVARADADPHVRLAGAGAPGAEDAATLVALVLDLASPPEVRETALVRLAEAAPTAAAEVVLALLDRTPDGLTPQALSLAAHLGLRAAFPRIAALLTHPDSDIGAAAAACLGGLAEPAAEPILLDVLTTTPIATRTAAVEALGTVGTLAAVAPLLQALEKGAVPRKVAREAIQRIQGRHARAGAGALALAETDVGGLSLARSRGGLALATEAIEE